MSAADLRQKSGPLADSLRGSNGHRRRFSLGSLSLGEDMNEEACEGMDLENESNYALIRSSGSGRHKRSCSYSRCSSNSSSSSLSSPLWSPCSAGSTSQAGVPFSWEDRPGVPKQKPDVSDFRELPPPPSSAERRGQRRLPRKKADDPFVTALVECTRQGIKDGRGGRATRQGGAASGYSCMRACATVDSQIAVPRARVVKESSVPTSKKDGSEKSSERLLYKSCRSENTELVAAKALRHHKQPSQLRYMQASWNVELCRSVLHR